MNCPTCGALELYPLGILGSTAWLKCRRCGANVEDTELPPPCKECGRLVPSWADWCECVSNLDNDIPDRVREAFQAEKDEGDVEEWNRY